MQLGTNKQAFQDATSHLGVPKQYLDLIWTALQTVPNKQELDRKLAEALTAPPTEEEFRWAIKDQKKSTTLGMSNVTYGNIKDWPEELITHCYHIFMGPRVHSSSMEREMGYLTGQDDRHGRHQ